ncbi:MAG: hypothetical protein ABJE10_23790 [bacterium]
MNARRKKSWSEKLESTAPHEIKRAPISIAGMRAGQLMLVPTPRMIDEYIRAIPKGHSVDVKRMRMELAEKFGTEVTCPIYCGFHLRTVAEAAFEAHQLGASLRDVTPFWRMLDERAPTTKKVSCGVAFIMKQRARERIPGRNPP